MILLVIGGLILVILIYFGLEKFNNYNPFSPNPPSAETEKIIDKEAAQRREKYEKYKSEIKTDLKLSEEDFQLLKKYSAD